MKTIILLTLALGTTGCLSLSSPGVPDTHRMKLSVDEKEMKSEVLSHVSIGESIEKAQESMEKSGFKCHFGRDRQGDFCLVCSQYMPRKSWLERFIMSDEIQVFVLFEQGKVTGVRVEHIRTCL